MPKLILYFELSKNTKTVYIKNKFDENFSGFLVSIFCVVLNYVLGRYWKNKKVF